MPLCNGESLDRTLWYILLALRRHATEKIGEVHVHLPGRNLESRECMAVMAVCAVLSDTCAMIFAKPLVIFCVSSFGTLGFTYRIGSHMCLIPK